MITEQPSKKYDVGLELKYCSILLRRVAESVGNMILAFLNLIIWIPQRSTDQSVDSSPPDTAGPQKSSEPKSGSAKYYVRTATGSTHLSSKTITPSPQSVPPCAKLIQPTGLNPEECAQLREDLISGRLDLTTISMATWLHVSYLELYNQQETHTNRAVVYNGNVYNLHFCVTGVVPPADAAKLREKQ